MNNMTILNYSTFYPFLDTHSLALIHASRSQSADFNDTLAHHFEASGYAITLGALDLGTGGDEWFGEYVRRSLKGHTKSSGYYLFVGGRAIARHSGVAKGTTADSVAVNILGGFFVAALSNSDPLDGLLSGVKVASDEAAAEMIGLFERKLRETAIPAKTQPSASPPDPFTVLQISRSATVAEIEKAKRQRLQEYHPDKFGFAGEEIRQLADRKTREIIEAHAKIVARKKASTA